MSHDSPPLSVLVLGDPETRVGSFVERNLDASGITSRFVDSTESFVRLSQEIDPSRLILIEPDWDLMLTLDPRRARLFVVQWRGDTWTPPWEDAGFEVRDPYLDDGLFRGHIMAWLREG